VDKRSCLVVVKVGGVEDRRTNLGSRCGTKGKLTLVFGGSGVMLR
jgi:hypothetical protein